MSKHVRRRFHVGLAILCLLVVCATGTWLIWDQPVERDSAPVYPHAQAISPLVSKPESVPARATCSTGDTFTPTWISIQGVTDHLPVLGVARTLVDVSGVLPVTTTSKWQVGWDDASARPGSMQGNVLLTAHTWPSFDPALGNQLLAKLNSGAKVILHGVNGQRACYQVTQIVTKPVADYPSDAVYRTSGSPGLAITVCSGERLGPGDWSDRTIWFAKAVK